MRVVNVARGRSLTMVGGLGPLQAVAVQGSMSLISCRMLTARGWFMNTTSVVIYLAASRRLLSLSIVFSWVS
jgi:hypothetical protein